MRFELLLFLSLACLAFTAQTAPASAKDALQEQKHKQRDSEPHKHKPKSGPHLHRHPKQHHDDHHHKSSHPDHGNNLKHTRGLVKDGLKAAEEITEVLVPENEAKLQARIDHIEKTHLRREKEKQREIERADIIEIAKHGAVPPKFPLVTVSIQACIDAYSLIPVADVWIPAFWWLAVFRELAALSVSLQQSPTSPTSFSRPRLLL